MSYILETQVVDIYIVCNVILQNTAVFIQVNCQEINSYLTDYAHK